MIINEEGLATLHTAFNAAFTRGKFGAKSTYRDVAMVVPSTDTAEEYGWLGQMPRLRKWIGDRQVKNLSLSKYSIVNELFELTVGVPRTSIEDDKYGIYSPIMQQMGQSAAEHPDELIYSLLAAGFTTNGYDGVPFFSASHKIHEGTSLEATVSNLTVAQGEEETGPAWFMFDTSKAIRPLIFQERVPYDFTPLTNKNDPNVFWKDQYVYGVRARANAGFGLWQLAAACTGPLTGDNYAAIRAEMSSLKGEEGKPLGIAPNVLVVPPSLESDARTILFADNIASTVSGETSVFSSMAVSNPWKGTASLIVSPWLA